MQGKNQEEGSDSQLQVIVESPKKQNYHWSEQSNLKVSKKELLNPRDIFSNRIKVKPQQAAQHVTFNNGISDNYKTSSNLFQYRYSRSLDQPEGSRTSQNSNRDELRSQKLLAKQFEQKRSEEAERLIQQYNRKRQQEKKRQLQKRGEQLQKQETKRKEQIRRKNHQVASFLGSIIGQQQKPHKKVKTNQESSGLKNASLLSVMEQQQQAPAFQDLQQRRERKKKQIMGVSTNQVVASYRPQNPITLIKLILAHDFRKDFLKPEDKKILTIFKDCMVYVKTFHYLLANECVADIQQRLRRVPTHQEQLIRVSIMTVQRNNQGFTEISLRQSVSNKTVKSGNSKETFILKSFSLSKYRLGLITNKLPFNVKNYGVPSRQNKKEFSFLCLLLTPEDREQLNSDVKVLSCINQYELQVILKQTNSRDVYFIDFEKISTHIREYKAVSDMPLFELAPFLLNPRTLEQHQTGLIDNRELLNPILHQLQKHFNTVQYNSIRQMVYRQNGIVMLQGPPGTGKTSTLLGLLSAQYEYFRVTQNTSTVKIMICAPSNAAIDHIVRRIASQGLVTSDQNEKVFPKILRVGIVQTDDQLITSVSLDHICQAQVKKLKQSNDKCNLTTPQIREQIIELQKQLKKLVHQKNIRYSIGIQEKINGKKQEIGQYESQLFEFRRQKVQLKNQYSQIEKKLLDEAEIILTTLSSSGSDKMERIRGRVGCLIVDQAAQATEPNLLVSLQSGARKVLLIGDPYQLPATTMSTDSSTTLFNRSLFERLIDSGLKPYFLNIQYRMEPLIRQFPSKSFYQNRLQDSHTIQERSMPKELQSFSNRNVIFLDINFGSQKRKEKSYGNQGEAYAIAGLLQSIQHSELSVGIITPYEFQRRLILRQLLSSQKYIARQKIKVNTVDSFQGQEKDIIIVSCVRSNSEGNIGFTVDERRINVTLTRAKHLLIVVGNGDTLGSNETWNNFLLFSESLKSYYRVNYKSEVKLIIQKLKSSMNDDKIERHKHSKLSKDFRRTERTEIQGKDFVHEKNKKIVQSYFAKVTSDQKIEQKAGEIEPKYHYEYKSLNKQLKRKDRGPLSNSEARRVPVSKQVAHIPEVLLQQKQDKLEQAFRLQEVNRNVNEMERRVKNGQIEDDFLKQLYQS